MSPGDSWLLIANIFWVAVVIGMGRYARAMRRIAMKAQQDAERLELQQADIALGLTDPRYRRKKLKVVHPDGVHLATRYGRRPR